MAGRRGRLDWIRGDYFLSRECRDCGSDLAHGEKLICQDCAQAKLRENGDSKTRRWRKTVRSEPYTLREIAHRDRYRCQICLRLGRARRAKINMRLTAPNRMAPTIDHVVPRSRGGDDTRANVQLAHFACNSWKHSGRPELSEQLALIG